MRIDAPPSAHDATMPDPQAVEAASPVATTAGTAPASGDIDADAWQELPDPQRVASAVDWLAATAAAPAERRGSNGATPPWPDPLLGHVASLQVGHRARLAQAEELEGNGRHADAASLYLKSLERDRSARALVGAGFNLAQSGYQDRGLELMREGVNKDPEDATARTKRLRK